MVAAIFNPLGKKITTSAKYPMLFILYIQKAAYAI
jgi:hypothetical protein